MITIREAIVVEGRYDINKVRQIFDTAVIETRGFGIYKDKEKLQLIRKLAVTCGVILLFVHLLFFNRDFWKDEKSQ